MQQLIEQLDEPRLVADLRPATVSVIEPNGFAVDKQEFQVEDTQQLYTWINALKAAQNISVAGDSRQTLADGMSTVDLAPGVVKSGHLAMRETKNKST